MKRKFRSNTTSVCWFLWSNSFLFTTGLYANCKPNNSRQKKLREGVRSAWSSAPLSRPNQRLSAGRPCCTAGRGARSHHSSCLRSRCTSSVHLHGKRTLLLQKSKVKSQSQSQVYSKPVTGYRNFSHSHTHEYIQRCIYIGKQMNRSTNKNNKRRGKKR